MYSIMGGTRGRAASTCPHYPLPLSLTLFNLTSNQFCFSFKYTMVWSWAVTFGAVDRQIDRQIGLGQISEIAHYHAYISIAPDAHISREQCRLKSVCMTDHERPLSQLVLVTRRAVVGYLTANISFWFVLSSVQCVLLYVNDELRFAYDNDN